MARLSATTYEELHAAACRTAPIPAKIGHNTTVELGLADPVLVRLHGHPIAKVAWDAILITSAGYRTTITKDRLNQLLRPFGARVFARDFVWYLETDKGVQTFFDGITVDLSEAVAS